MLESELRKKSETIISLNGHIGRLSGADLILRENGSLKQQNEELQQKADAASAKASSVKEDCCKKIAAEKNRLKQKYNEKSHELEENYSLKTALSYTITVISVLINALFFLFWGIKSERFSSDTKDALSLIGGLLSKVWDGAVYLASAAWSINEDHPYHVINIIIPGLLAAIGFVVFIGVITYLTGYIIYTGVKSYAEQFGDWLSAFVILVPLVILIMFADDLTFISWNLVLIYLIIQGIYLVLRLYFGEKK